VARLIGGSLSSNICDDLWVQNTLLVDAHIGGEGGSWGPFRRVAGVGLLQHAVDLLERETLGLGHEEVGVYEGAGAERSPDEEDLRSKVTLVSVDHVWGDNTDDLL
jgi:hypothetical protein